MVVNWCDVTFVGAGFHRVPHVGYTESRPPRGVISLNPPGPEGSKGR